MDQNKIKSHWSGLPEYIKNLLIDATANWDKNTDNETIEKAIDLSGRNPDVLIGAYRYYFYKHDFHRAGEIAIEIIQTIEQSEIFHLDMDEENLAFYLTPRLEESNIRLYLNTASALALVYGKLNRIQEGIEIAEKVSHLDTKKEFGAASVLRILRNETEEI